MRHHCSTHICLPACPQERDELATCGMGNKVKIWDVSRPTSVRLKLVLNHGGSSRMLVVVLVRPHHLMAWWP